VALLDPDGRPIQSSSGAGLADVDERELLARLAEEIGGLMLSGQRLSIEIDPLQVLQVAGVLQLAFRHPAILEAAGESANSAAELLAAFRQFFQELGADYALEILRRGDDPTHDKPHAARLRP
jgi:hypothetical protein